MAPTPWERWPGAYLCGFWLIPTLGLTVSIVAAAAVNLVVAGAVLAIAGNLRIADNSATEEESSAASMASPEEASSATAGRPVFLLFFALSGFVAIGYEVVWSKLFGIVMEGTLYGFAAVLTAYLLGIGLGSLAMAPVVDCLRDLPRVFALLHAGTALTVAVGMAAVPYLPYALARLSAAGRSTCCSCWRCRSCCCRRCSSAPPSRC